jgi:hypothetical protein
VSIDDHAERLPEVPAPGPAVPGAPGTEVDAGATLTTEPYRAGRLALAGLLLTGFLIAVIGVGVAAARTVVRGTTVPWGVVMVLLALGVCVRAGGWLLGTRRGSSLVALGWLLPTLTFATVNPGGDVLLPDVPRTYVYLVGGVAVVLVATLWRLPAGVRDLVEAPGQDAPASG